MNPPALELRLDGRSLRVPAERPFVIGRGPEVDLDLPHPRISRRHAVVELTPGGWILTDRSSNGTFVDGHRIGVLPLTDVVAVRLGDAADATIVEFRPVREQAAVAAGGRMPDPAAGTTTVHHVSTARLTIGRLPDNDVVLDDLLVSRRHAELRRSGPGWVLVDLGSGNGTFVNGVRVSQAEVGPTDVIGIGHGLLQLQGDRLVAAVDTGDVAFSAHGLTVATAQGRLLLRDIAFSLPERTLLAVVGPSGAGKSTLLRALTGARPADRGHVRYAGRDLYTEYDELRHRIGLVPQDDVLHPQLTVRRALRFAARLRFPTDVPAADRDRRVEEVLAELELTGQGDQRIDTLSGGQRKRTSVALELLTTPSLLFLDEPTSGLDPGLDRSVMQTLRGLSDGGGGRGGTRPAGGRTVVVVTHSVLNLDMCDLLLVLAPGGHLAYFGPPREALRYFGQPDFSEMFLLLGGSPGRSWPPATGRPRNISATSPHPRRRCRACRTAPRCRAPRRASSRCSPSSPC